jgi:glutamate--cysteine ligase
MDIDIPTFSKTLQQRQAQGLFDTLPGIRRGIEKEALRVLPDGTLSRTPHPYALGSSLTHPHITTDYSESLLEFISTPWTSVRGLLQELHHIEQFTHSVLQSQAETLWATSMPCRLPNNPVDIPIAQYGNAYPGRIKTIYRQGLGLRYGRKMQTIAGLHYNFSFPDTFWMNYQATSGQTQATLPEFISDQYFHLIRNVLRWRWLLPLWFGASPAVDSSFLAPDCQPDSLVPHLAPVSARGQANHTWISPYATSLRLSPLGYHNTNARIEHGISYNTLPDFLSDLRKAVTTVSPEFSAIGVLSNGEYLQLNDTCLQIENEFYGIIRPKNTLAPQERLLHALKTRGVGYIELRALDLNPFEPNGISSQHLHLLDVFLTTCLLLDSPLLSHSEEALSHADYQTIVIEGRKKNLRFAGNTTGKSASVQERSTKFLDALRAVAEQFDQALQTQNHIQAIEMASQQIQNPQENSLCAEVFESYAQHRNNHIDFGQYISQERANYFLKQPLSKPIQADFEAMATRSFSKQQVLETEYQPPFAEYLHNYLKNI